MRNDKCIIIKLYLSKAFVSHSTHTCTIFFNIAMFSLWFLIEFYISEIALLDVEAVIDIKEKEKIKRVKCGKEMK